MIFVFIACIFSYLIGSIPTGYIFGKLVKKIDIREYGSGNVGATNVFRTIGKGYGITVLVIDFLKGFLAVILLAHFIARYAPEIDLLSLYRISIMIGALSISGHIWTCFLSFKGGKGVATTAGVLLALAWPVLLLALLIWVIIFAKWRYVSLASIVSASLLPVFSIVFGKDILFIIFSSAISITGVYKHKSNIKRLLSGDEKKLL